MGRPAKHPSEDVSKKRRDQGAIVATRPVPLSRLLAGEIAIGTAVNIAFNLVFAWLVFYGSAPIARDSILLDVLPATFLPALLMTFPITFLMRKRIDGGLTVNPMMRPPVALPRPLPRRAVAVAVLSLAVVAAPVVVLLWAFWARDWSWHVLVLFKIGFSALHAALVTPLVVLAALALDRGAPAAANI